MHDTPCLITCQGEAYRPEQCSIVQFPVFETAYFTVFIFFYISAICRFIPTYLCFLMEIDYYTVIYTQSISISVPHFPLNSDGIACRYQSEEIKILNI